MREILFRGFTPDKNARAEITVKGEKVSGMWVTGYYWEPRDTTFCFKQDYDMHPNNTKHFILFDEMTDWGLPNRHMQADVLPETVGQFTGRCDIKNHRVFEHDVIKHHFGNEVGVIRYGSYRNPFGDDAYGGHVGFYVDWISGDAPQTLRKDLDYWLNIVEIAGNIHDKPELLEGYANV